MKERYSLDELFEIANDIYKRGDAVSVELFMDMLASRDAYKVDYTKEDIVKIYPFVEDIWHHLESDVAVQKTIDKIFFYIKYNNVSADELIQMSRYDLMEKIWDLTC